MKKWKMLQTILVLTLLVTCGSVFANVKVAVVKSYGNMPVFTELNNNWGAYGSVPLTIDTSLMYGTCTYQNLVNTGADVLWLSDPAGIGRQYSAEEVAAITQYVNEGHSILGTFMVFQWRNNVDNRALAPIFGLRQDITYNNDQGIQANQAFQIIASHPLFRNLPDPYISNGYPQAQVPADDLKWDASDFGSAQLLALTTDKRGVITWYQTASYHAIFVSEMVEYNGNQSDTQFLYNALTVPEPATLLLLGLGGLILRRKV